MSKRSSGFGWFVLLAAGLAALAFFLQPPAVTGPDPAVLAEARKATGGAQTLEDILARQRGEKVDLSFRREFGAPGADPNAPLALAPLGGASDPDLWRALRHDAADVNVSAGGDVAKVLVQDGGMAHIPQGPPGQLWRVAARWHHWRLVPVLPDARACPY